MLSISIGPFAFPVAPLITIAAIWIGAMVAGYAAEKSNAPRAENALWIGAIAGLIGARLGYVIAHHEAYLKHPLSIIDVRDGGWLAWAGFGVAALWLARLAWRHLELRKAVIAGATTGAAIWLTGNAALWYSQGGGKAQPVPDVAVTSLTTGQSSSLAQVVSGKPAVINLWATWCGPCRVEMPTLVQAQADQPDVRFVFVNHGEMPPAIKAYLSREKLDIKEVWLDKNLSLGTAIGSNGLPTTLFIDAKGHQVDAHFGVLSAAALAAKLAELLDQ